MQPNPSTPHVHLSGTEVACAMLIAARRRLENVRIHKRKDAHGFNPQHAWHAEIEGVMAEMALAKHLDHYYGGAGEFRGADVGDIEQVKQTTYPKGRLCLNFNAVEDNHRYWLLIGRDGDYDIKGWIWGRDAQKDEFIDDPLAKKKGIPKDRPAWFVPWNALTQENGRIRTPTPNTRR